jgi:hypothetical protein
MVWDKRIMKKGFTPNYCVNCGYHYEPWVGDKFGMCYSCDVKENERAFIMMGRKITEEANSPILDKCIPLVRKYGVVKMAKTLKINKNTLMALCNPTTLVGNPPFKRLEAIMEVLNCEIIVIDSATKERKILSFKKKDRVKDIEQQLLKKDLEFDIIPKIEFS